MILDKQLSYQSRESFVQVRRREEGTNNRILGTETKRNTVNVFSILRTGREPEKYGHPHGEFLANSRDIVDLGFLISYPEKANSTK